MKLISTALPKNINGAMRRAFERARVKGIPVSSPDACMMRSKSRQILYQPKIVRLCKPFFEIPKDPPKAWDPSVYILVKKGIYETNFINISGQCENGRTVAFKEELLPTDFPSIYFYYTDLDAAARNRKPSNYCQIFLTFDPYQTVRDNIDLILKNTLKYFVKPIETMSQQEKTPRNFWYLNLPL